MFILRKLPKNGIQQNITLGDNYSVIYKDLNEDFFKSYAESQEEKGFSVSPSVFAIVQCDKHEALEIFDTDIHYVMTENGKTFARFGRTGSK